jgi:hypothetical protein
MIGGMSDSLKHVEETQTREATVKLKNTTWAVIGAISGIIGLSHPAVATGPAEDQGSAKGEASQQLGQQGVGLGSTSSNVILGGPEIIMGSIRKINGEEYTISGELGQDIRIRVTADTNKVCASSGQAHVSTGQKGAREQTEIPPTAFMEGRQSAQAQGSRTQGEPSRDQQDLKRHAEAPPSRDPLELKGKIGSTDPRANEDVARGSGFTIGECSFKEGDHVRVEASDMGTATTIKQLVDSRTDSQMSGEVRDLRQP